MFTLRRYRRDKTTNSREHVDLRTPLTSYWKNSRTTWLPPSRRRRIDAGSSGDLTMTRRASSVARRCRLAGLTGVRAVTPVTATSSERLGASTTSSWRPVRLAMVARLRWAVGWTYSGSSSASGTATKIRFSMSGSGMTRRPIVSTSSLNNDRSMSIVRGPFFIAQDREPGPAVLRSAAQHPHKSPQPRVQSPAKRRR